MRFPSLICQTKTSRAAHCTILPSETLPRPLCANPWTKPGSHSAQLGAASGLPISGGALGGGSKCRQSGASRGPSPLAYRPAFRAGSAQIRLLMHMHGGMQSDAAHLWATFPQRLLSPASGTVPNASWQQRPEICSPGRWLSGHRGMAQRSWRGEVRLPAGEEVASAAWCAAQAC